MWLSRTIGLVMLLPVGCCIVIVHSGKWIAQASIWACPHGGWPLNPSTWAWQEVKDKAVSVNEEGYLCWNLLAAGSRGTSRK